MRSKIKAWVSRYLVDTFVEVEKLKELAEQMTTRVDNLEQLSNSCDLNQNSDDWWRFDAIKDDEHGERKREKP